MQFGQVIGPAVSERFLDQLPHAFVGIEIRRVGWEVLKVKSAIASAELPDGITAVNGSQIPKNVDMAAQMSQQMAEKGTDLRVLDVLGVQPVVQAQAMAPGADGNPRDDRDAIAPGAMAYDRRLPSRGPGVADARDQEEARFVREDDVGREPRGVFFTCTQRWRFHRSTLASSRSRARRSGFW